MRNIHQLCRWLISAEKPSWPPLVGQISPPKHVFFLSTRIELKILLKRSESSFIRTKVTLVLAIYMDVLFLSQCPLHYSITPMFSTLCIQTTQMNRKHTSIPYKFVGFFLIHLFRQLLGSSNITPLCCVISQTTTQQNDQKE